MQTVCPNSYVKKSQSATQPEKEACGGQGEAKSTLSPPFRGAVAPSRAFIVLCYKVDASLLVQNRTSKPVLNQLAASSEDSSAGNSDSRIAGRVIPV